MLGIKRCEGRGRGTILFVWLSLNVDKFQSFSLQLLVEYIYAPQCRINGIFLLKYGFVVKNNPNDAVLLKVHYLIQFFLNSSACLYVCIYVFITAILFQ